MDDLFPITSTEDGEINIECRYNSEYQITDFFINKQRVEGDAAVLLADIYDNETLERDIKEAEQAETEIIEFQMAHQPDYPRRAI